MKINEDHDWNHHLISNNESCDDGAMFWILCSIEGCGAQDSIHL